MTIQAFLISWIPKIQCSRFCNKKVSITRIVYLEQLKAEGKSVVEIDRASAHVMRERTREAMQAGPDVIAQAYLELGKFGGLADFLVRVPGSSKFGGL